MAPGEEAESSSNDTGFGELVDRIRIGDQNASNSLRLLVTVGVEFLLRHKLAQVDVSAEVAAVIQATIEAVPALRPSQSLNLPALIVSTIHAHFPPSPAAVPTRRPDSAAIIAAQSVLAEMTPLERRIMNEYYAVGAAQDTIQRRLHVGPQIIKRTLAKARAAFFRRAAGS